MNDVLSKSSDARRRQLSLPSFKVVPLTPRMRLVEHDPSFTSLAGIYEVG